MRCGRDKEQNKSRHPPHWHSGWSEPNPRTQQRPAIHDLASSTPISHQRPLISEAIDIDIDIRDGTVTISSLMIDNPDAPLPPGCYSSRP